MDAEFDDEDEASDMAETLKQKGFTEVEVMVDIATADETARAMAFTPFPVLGRVTGRDAKIEWQGQPVAAAPDAPGTGAVL